MPGCSSESTLGQTSVYTMLIDGGPHQCLDDNTNATLSSTLASPSSFTKFTSLPLEIQDEIWRLVISRPRIILSRPRFSRFDLRFDLNGPDLLPVLLTSRSANRLIMQTHQRLSLGDNCTLIDWGRDFVGLHETCIHETKLPSPIFQNCRNLLLCIDLKNLPPSEVSDALLLFKNLSKIKFVLVEYIQYKKSRCKCSQMCSYLPGLDGVGLNEWGQFPLVEADKVQWINWFEKIKQIRDGLEVDFLRVVEMFG